MPRFNLSRNLGGKEWLGDDDGELIPKIWWVDDYWRIISWGVALRGLGPLYSKWLKVVGRQFVKKPARSVVVGIATMVFWLGRLHSPSLTWNLKMMVSKRNLLFRGTIFRFYVKLWEGYLKKKSASTLVMMDTTWMFLHPQRRHGKPDHTQDQFL